MKPFYVTTSIVYPNADPHIGFALEQVQGDFIARYMRLQGQETFYLTGCDVHGLKIQRTAEKTGVSPEEFIDVKVAVYQVLAEKLQLTHGRFIRTDDMDHQAMAQALWKACEAKGDIYKKQYKAWYNVKEEEFLGLFDEAHPEPPADSGVDPQFIELIDEENYFFRLSRYKDEIIASLNTGSYKVFPQSRAQELLNFIEDKGLEDVSISREKAKLSWGVPVPGDDTQVMYVWFDALTNYLSGCSTVDGQGTIQLGQNWPASLHIVGKDISRFHGILWTGMLLSAGIQLPEQLLIHGFLTKGGQKISKSTGNVVDPLAEIETFGSDALRYYLLKHVPTTGDADYTSERMKEVYTADLANDFGNLVSRVWTMCQKYAQGKVPDITRDEIDNMQLAEVREAWQAYHAAVEKRELHQAVEQAHNLTVYCNKRIEESKPWAMAKEPDEAQALKELLYELLEVIRHITLMLKPVMPTTVEKIEQGVFPELEKEKLISFENGSVWGGLQSGQLLGTEQLVLFPRQ